MVSVMGVSSGKGSGLIERRPALRPETAAHQGADRMRFLSQRRRARRPASGRRCGLATANLQSSRGGDNGFAAIGGGAVRALPPQVGQNLLPIYAGLAHKLAPPRGPGEARRSDDRQQGNGPRRVCR